jgi:hypothetical protein
MLLQFTKGAKGDITGSEDDAALSGAPPYISVGTQATSFAGSIAGAWLTLNFKGQPAPVYGKLAGRALLLEVPQRDGSFTEVTLAKAAPAEYGTALGALQLRAMTESQAVIAPTNPAALCSKDCLPLPPVPNGYSSVGVFASSRASDLVDLVGHPLEVCFAVAGSISNLAYEIGPANDPTSLHQAGLPSNGCAPDLRTHSGLTAVAITANGTGNWTVRIDEATSTEVSALQQEAQGQQAVDQDAQAVSSDESGLLDDISGLRNDEQSLAADTSDIERYLSVVQGDLAHLRSDVKQNPSSVCAEAGSVSGGEGWLEDERASYLRARASQLVDASRLQQGASALRSDWSALIAAEAAAPSYAPSGGLLPRSGEVAVLAVASSALSKYQQTVTASTRAIAVYVVQAQGYVTQADRLCSSPGG